MSTQTTMHSLARMTPNLTRILGQNPGPYTLQGTNTYMLWASPKRILIDTSEGKQEYINYLERDIRTNTPYLDKPITDIVLTHWHPDHVRGVWDVLDLCKKLWPDSKRPVVHKFPCPERDEPIFSVPEKYQASYGKHLDFEKISEGYKLGPVTFLHTPGHSKDSVSMHVSEPYDYILTADTILGSGTTVFEDLKEYLDSLHKLRKIVDSLGTPPPNSTSRTLIQLYPGHGPAINDGLAKIDEYITHRLEREANVINALYAAGAFAADFDPQQEPDQGLVKKEPVSVLGIVEAIYNGTLHSSVIGSAARGIRLHLEKLLTESKVEKIDNANPDHSQWTLTKFGRQEARDSASS